MSGSGTADNTMPYNSPDKGALVYGTEDNSPMKGATLNFNSETRGTNIPSVNGQISLNSQTSLGKVDDLLHQGKERLDELAIQRGLELKAQEAEFKIQVQNNSFLLAPYGSGPSGETGVYAPKEHYEGGNPGDKSMEWQKHQEFMHDRK